MTTEANKPNTSAQADATANDRFSAAKARRAAAEAYRASPEGKVAVRERIADLGGQRLKLSVVGTIPGFHLYWENDEDGKIEQLLIEGFDFVAPGEVQRASDLVADMDIAHRISRYVGRQQDGSPLRAYLLKCPDELWDARSQVDQARVDMMDDQIRNGRMKPKAEEGEYAPKGVSSYLSTKPRN